MGFSGVARLALATAFGAGASISGVAVTAGPAAALISPPPGGPSITLTGHGWGHGRGMGQYGAFGYALSGLDYQDILAHYYGGTTLSEVPTALVNVDLSAFDGHDTIVQMTAPPLASTNPQIQATWGGGGQVTGQSALLVHHNADGTLSVSTGPGCAGPWTPLAAAAAVGDVSITSATETLTSGTDSMLQACPPDGSRHWYQGAIVTKAAAPQTWNVLPVDEYTQGVVPRESPSYWGTAGGEAALEAQAVAARSYALSYVAANGSICDTTACQVYGGRAVLNGPNYADLYGVSPYSASSDAAVSATAGQVLLCTGSAGCPAGTVARTEFSSSTGGWSAGGTFPPVVDDGDAISGNGNPNHTWAVDLSYAQIQAAYPSIGAFSALNVTSRNGLGDLGGRVLQLQVIGSAGTVMTSGGQFAAALGLKSDWFAAISTPGGPTPGPGANTPATDTGYWLVAPDGGIFTFGARSFYGSTGAMRLNSPVLGGASTPDGGGYWLVAGDGGIFSFGDAAFHGSTGNMVLNQPVVGMAAARDGGGYWLVASDGGIFTFGDATFHGSTGAERLNKPIVGMASTPDGGGYWLVASDGGIFSFGDAGFCGSTGAMTLNQPIVGMAVTPDGGGYWLVAADGGVFSFGDARYLGSVPGLGATDRIVALDPTPDGGGYLEISAAGKVYAFGDATSYGGMADAVPGYTGRILGLFGG